MADQEPSRGLLWMFRRKTPDGDAALDPSRSLYTLFKNSRNPFLQRAVAPARRPAGSAGQPVARSAGELSRLVKFLAHPKQYRVAPLNQAEPFQRRQLKHPPTASGRDPRYLDAGRLPGDPQRLPFLVDGFFDSTLARLRGDPQEFEAVVRELTALFREHGITLRVYEAYHALQDWNDLMDTLEEIARYPSVETFDLFCSALLAYHDLVHGNL